jgi:hypothetical protein
MVCTCWKSTAFFDLVATGFTLGLPSAGNHHTMFQMKWSRKCRTSNWLWTIWRIGFDGGSCWLRTQLLCGKRPLIIFAVTMKKSFTDCHRSVQEMIQIVLGNVFTISLLTFPVQNFSCDETYTAHSIFQNVGVINSSTTFLYIIFFSHAEYYP